MTKRDLRHDLCICNSEEATRYRTATSNCPEIGNGQSSLVELPLSNSQVSNQSLLHLHIMAITQLLHIRIQSLPAQPATPELQIYMSLNVQCMHVYGVAKLSKLILRPLDQVGTTCLRVRVSSRCRYSFTPAVKVAWLIKKSR